MIKNKLRFTLISFLVPVFLPAAPGWVTLDPTLSDQLSIEVVSSDIRNTVLDIRVTGYYEETTDVHGRDHLQITAPGMTPLLQAAAPDLPKLHRSIIIPDDAHMAIETEVLSWIDISVPALAPSKGNFTRNILPSAVAYQFGPEYSRDEFFPSTIAELGKPYILRDYRGVVVKVHPFRYNPQSGTLRIYTHLQLTISADGPARVNPKSDRKSWHARGFRPIYENRFLNNGQAGVLYEAPYEVGPMLIITGDSYHDALLPLVDWKQAKGIPTELVSISDIGNNSTVIQNAIQERYNSPEGLTYVLLVGDNSDVTTTYVSGDAADPTYACVDGDNGDWYPDLFVGRFSANNVAHVETQVAKVLLYEAGAEGTEDWYLRGTGIGSAEGAGIGDDGESDIQHLNNIRADLLGYGYTEVDQIYDPGANSTQVANAINDGRGFLNYTGHGSTTAWSSSGFSVSNVNNLSNTGMLPVINSVACVNGNFTNNTCFAESWLRAGSADDPRGALAFYGSSINQSWAPPMSAQDETVDLLVAEANTVVGALMFNGSCLMMDEYGSGGWNMFATWHLFGDPSAQIYSGTPAVIETVTHPDVMVIGASELTIDVPGVNQGMAALMLDEEILACEDLDDLGPVTLSFEALAEPDTLLLTITAHNMIPYQTELLIIAPDGPYLILGEASIEDSITGNGNNTADFGEALDLNLVIHNVGTENAAELAASMTTVDPFVTITSGTATAALVEANGSVTVGPFSLAVSPEAPDGHNAALDVDLAAGSENWDHSFDLILHAPVMAMGDVVVADDNNGRLDIGESVILDLIITNEGTCPLAEGSITLATEDPFVSITENLGWINGIEPGATGTCSFGVDVAIATPPSHEIQFTWNLLGDYGYTASGSFILVAGEVIENFESGDFSAFEWQMGGQQDWIIDATNAFEGSYAARSGDVYNNQNSDLSLTISVTEASPITFNYKVSSQSGDGLVFLVNGEEMETFEGDIEWTQTIYWLSPGDHELTWRYDKDYTGSSGNDCAWLDFIVFPITAIPGTIIGDVTADTYINVQDIVRLVNIILGEGAEPQEFELYCGDVNGDGLIDIGDLVLLVNYIMGVGRESIGDEPEVFINENQLQLRSEMPIAGFEMHYSGTFAPSLADFEFVSRKTESGTHALSYNLSGTSITGNVVLGAVSPDWELNTLKLANRAGQVFDVSPQRELLPEDFAVAPNYPNPFNPSTTIGYSIPGEMQVTIRIYDVRGNQVTSFDPGLQQAGNYTMTWEALNDAGQALGTGVYFARIQAGEDSRIIKMMYLK